MARCPGRGEIGADIRSECVLTLLTLRFISSQMPRMIRARDATVARTRKKEKYTIWVGRRKAISQI